MSLNETPIADLPIGTAVPVGHKHTLQAVLCAVPEGKRIQVATRSGTLHFGEVAEMPWNGILVLRTGTGMCTYIDCDNIDYFTADDDV